jgi:hypothetical protein
MGRAVRSMLSCLASGAVAVGITLYAMAPAAAALDDEEATSF